MSTKEHQEFFPENFEFLGFVGGWDCFIGVVTVEMLFYLIRTKDLDWLEAVVKYSSTILSRNCVMSAPRHGPGGRRRRGFWMLTSAPGFTMNAPFRRAGRGC